MAAKRTPAAAPVVESVEPTITREAWLQAAVAELRPWVEETGSTVPDVSISFGWPGGRGKKKGVVGQCWAASTAADAKPAIFISPVHSEALDTLGTVLHEMIHAAGHHAHKGGFAKTAAALGFGKPFTATPVTEAMKPRLEAVLAAIGPLEHGRVTSGAGPTVQSTRMIKCECSECGYTVRTTRKWLAVATPTCPVDEIEMEVS